MSNNPAASNEKPLSYDDVRHSVDNYDIWNLRHYMAVENLTTISCVVHDIAYNILHNEESHDFYAWYHHASDDIDWELIARLGEKAYLITQDVLVNGDKTDEEAYDEFRELVITTLLDMWRADSSVNE